MLQENLLSNLSRFVYQNVETPSESEAEPVDTGKGKEILPYPEYLTKGGSAEKAAENVFYAQLGPGVGKFRNFLEKVGEEGGRDLQFEKDVVSYWLKGEQYRIPASFVREVKDPSNQEEVKEWLSKLGEKGARNLNFDETGISYWYEGNKYNIPGELLR